MSMKFVRIFAIIPLFVIPTLPSRPDIPNTPSLPEMPEISGQSHGDDGLFQITTDPNQQTSPLVNRDLVVWTDWRGFTDIWGYDRKTKEEFPIIQKDGIQWATGLSSHYLIYSDDKNIGENDVRAYDLRRGEDFLIAGGPENQGNGVTNGRHVAYIVGGACGDLRLYDIRRGKIIPVADTDGFQDTPKVFGNNAAWIDHIGGGRGTPHKLVVGNIRSGKQKVLYETTNAINWPAISRKFVVWSESPAPHRNKVMAANLRTGEIIELQPEGPHQNSNTMPSISKDLAVWQAWRTGNGDIYGYLFE